MSAFRSPRLAFVLAGARAFGSDSELGECRIDPRLVATPQPYRVMENLCAADGVTLYYRSLCQSVADVRQSELDQLGKGRLNRQESEFEMFLSVGDARQNGRRRKGNECT